MYNNFREKRGVDPREYYNRSVVGSGSPTRAPAASTSPQSSERGAVARPRPSAAPEGSDVDVDEYFVDGLAGAQDVANGRYVLAHTSGGRGVYRQSLSAGMDAGSERAWLFHSAGAWLLSPELAGYGSLPLRPLGTEMAMLRLGVCRREDCYAYVPSTSQGPPVNGSRDAGAATWVVPVEVSGGWEWKPAP